MDPILSCVDANGKAGAFGGIKGGFLIQCGLAHARSLLSKPPPTVLNALGQKFEFELAVGVNGRVWVSSGSCSSTIKVANVLQQAEEIPAADLQQWLTSVLS